MSGFAWTIVQNQTFRTLKSIKYLEYFFETTIKIASNVIFRWSTNWLIDAASVEKVSQQLCLIHIVWDLWKGVCFKVGNHLTNQTLWFQRGNTLKSRVSPMLACLSNLQILASLSSFWWSTGKSNWSFTTTSQVETNRKKKMDRKYKHYERKQSSVVKISF